MKIKKHYQKSGIIIVNNDSILVLRKLGELKKYVLAGGFLKKKEIPETALIREVEEEIGVSLNIEDLTYLSSNTYYKKSKARTKHYFLLNNIQKNFVNMENHKFHSLEWINWIDACNHMNFEDANAIERYFIKYKTHKSWAV